MQPLTEPERVTLIRLAAPEGPAVFDGEVLCALNRRGIVEFSMEGWRLTPLGWQTLHSSGSASVLDRHPDDADQTRRTSDHPPDA